MRIFVTMISMSLLVWLAGCEGPKESTSPGAPKGAGAGKDSTPNTSKPAPASTPDANPAPSPAAAGSAKPGELSPANVKIGFVGSKKDGSHSGGFDKFTGTVGPLDKDLTAAKVTIDIDTDSLNSDNPGLTKHLKTPDFFDVKKFPKATFTSTAIKAEKTDKGTHTLTGDFNFHGVTKSISFPVMVKESPESIEFNGGFTISRLDYGMNFQPERVNAEVSITVSGKVARK